jgi:hypothetical protein
LRVSSVSPSGEPLKPSTGTRRNVDLHVCMRTHRLLPSGIQYKMLRFSRELNLSVMEIMTCDVMLSGSCLPDYTASGPIGQTSNCNFSDSD